MSIKKPSQLEEEYIAKQEALLRHKAAAEKTHNVAVEDRERLREAHYMKCPKCGMDLQTTVFRGVAIDKCYHCKGMWLDDGEIELLAGKGGDFLKKIVSIFRDE